MKTEVIMKRELFGREISQKSQSGFFSATDLVKAGNAWRVQNGLPFFDLNVWLQSKGTKEFILELEKQFGKIKINSTGKNQHTWVHPYLFIDIALAISPKLKIEIYKWITDELLKYRNSSGDSYKKMAGAIYITISNKSEFKNTIMVIADKIKLACGVKDWESADEKILKLRDKMHDYISLLCDVMRDIDQAANVGIARAIKENSPV